MNWKQSAPPSWKLIRLPRLVSIHQAAEAVCVFSSKLFEAAP